MMARHGAHVSTSDTSCSRLRSLAMASTSMTRVGVRTSLSVTIATARPVRHSIRDATRQASGGRGGTEHFAQDRLIDRLGRSYPAAAQFSKVPPQRAGARVA